MRSNRSLYRSNTRLSAWPALSPAGLRRVTAGLLGTAQDRLPAHVPGTQRGWPGLPRRPGEGRRAADAAAPERGTAAAHRPGAVRADRPGLIHRPGAAYTAQALGQSLPRDASDTAGLAPQTSGEEVRHEQAAQARAPADDPEHRPACRPSGEGVSAVGAPPDPRRTAPPTGPGRVCAALQRAPVAPVVGTTTSASPTRPACREVPASSEPTSSRA